jgi:hypothetical protein
MSQDHVNELINDLGFPGRFFIDLLGRRRVSGHTTTRTGDCWLMCDPLVSAITLERKQENDILSIIIVDYQRRYASIQYVVKRYISSKSYHRHPLFPILLIADAALEDYRDILESICAKSTLRGHLLKESGMIDFRNLQDTAFDLAYITFQREELTCFGGNLRAFHASVRNLMNLHDGRDVLVGGHGSLQSLSTQAGGQLIPLPLLHSTLQHLVSASGDILETVTSTDARLQHAFLVVRTCDGQDCSRSSDTDHP